MPTIMSVEKNGHIGHFVKLQPGEKVMLCRCYKSATFPLCDLIHQKDHNTLGPLIVEAIKGGAPQNAPQCVLGVTGPS